MPGSSAQMIPACLHIWPPYHASSHLPQVRHIIAGTAARTMAQCFIHPIDTVKTRLQVQHQPHPIQVNAWLWL